MKKSYIVSLEPGAAAGAVVERLRAAGAGIEQEMDAIGLVSVSADEETAASLRALPGVAAVEEPGEMRIAPPDAGIQ